jgi:hypothetical protein
MFMDCLAVVAARGSGSLASSVLSSFYTRRQFPARAIWADAFDTGATTASDRGIARGVKGLLAGLPALGE